MTTRIFCRTIDKGVQSLYINFEGRTYYLFRQNYRVSVKKYFGMGGVILDNALNHKKANGNRAILNTMRKLRSSIKYIEKYYGLEILKSTEKQNREYMRKCA